jgi:hypothetical protein
MFMVVCVLFYIDLFVHLARRRHVIFVILSSSSYV